MDAFNQVLAWLDNIQPVEERPACSEKRKRLSATEYASPAAKPPSPLPSSIGKMRRTSTPSPRKKPAAVIPAPSLGDVEAQRTPRQGDFAVDGDASSVLSAGRQSSPRRRKRALELHEQISWRDLAYWDMPDAARRLLDRLDPVFCGVDFIPRSARDEILHCADKRFQPALQFDTVFGNNGNNNQNSLPGRCPTPAEVKVILFEAERCANSAMSESSWNFKVHLAHLQAICREPYQTDEAVECTAAAPHPQFLPESASAHRVDLCICMNPAALADSDTTARQVADRLRHLCRRNPFTHAANHTDYAYLESRPICLGVETKKLGADSASGAELQLGVWLYAQWEFLRHWSQQQEAGGSSAAMSEGSFTAVAAAAAAAAVSTTYAASTDTTAANSDVRGGGGGGGDITQPTPGLGEQARRDKDDDDNDNELPFIPALIVQGHDWRLVLSTQDRATGKMVVWSGRYIASTQTARGVYQIVFLIRELMRWFRDVYWPWFGTSVLGVGIRG